MMLNDLDTSVFGEENELGDDSQSFYQQASLAQLHNFFRPTSTITTPLVKSLEISESGSSTSCIISDPSLGVGGGGISTSFVRGVWPQDWKIDPSAG